MNKFKKYRRTNVSEMREVSLADIKSFNADKNYHVMQDTEFRVSVSEADIKNGSPKIGDMIARNPLYHNDKWLVAKKYFDSNFEECK
jgi:hypothetical protein